MERLTNSIDFCKMHCDLGGINDCLFKDKSKCYENNIYNRLREYEDAEEQGLILRLPCKFGDTVYWIRPNVSGVPTEVMETKFDDSMISRLDLFGKVFFTTQEEAEQALKHTENAR